MTILSIILNMSAILCSIKYKSKIGQLIVECFYCVIIFTIPTLAISFLLVCICGQPDVSIWKVAKCIGTIMGLCCFYFIIVNRASEKKIEDYLLTISLSLQLYLKDERRIRKQKRRIVFEIFTFVVLFVLFWGGVSALMVLFRKEMYIITWISASIALAFAYVLFVYGKRDEETIEERKTIIGILITIIWFVLVYIRMEHYWKDINQIGVEDMFILFFSVVFTIPTIWGWVRTIPVKIVYPYTEEVEKQKREIIESFVKGRKDFNKGRIQFSNDVKDIAYILKTKWKKLEKKKKIKTIFVVFGGIVSIVFLLIIGNIIAKYLDNILSFVKIRVEEWYIDLDKGVHNIINKVFFSLTIVGSMIYAIVESLSLYKAKTTWSHKIKCILAVVILEVGLGGLTWMIWFTN